jgi:hypothetical protein
MSAKLIALLTILTLAGCAAVPAAQPASTPPPPMASAFGQPMQLMGMNAKALVAAFGQPRLDIQEPTMRKLQFANGTCVLDAYLYPPQPGKTPVVTYVDARLPTGKDTEVGGCTVALRVK